MCTYTNSNPARLPRLPNAPGVPALGYPVPVQASQPKPRRTSSTIVERAREGLRTGVRIAGPNAEGWECKGARTPLLCRLRGRHAENQAQDLLPPDTPGAVHDLELEASGLCAWMRVVRDASQGRASVGGSRDTCEMVEVSLNADANTNPPSAERHREDVHCPKAYLVNNGTYLVPCHIVSRGQHWLTSQCEYNLRGGHVPDFAYFGAASAVERSHRCPPCRRSCTPYTLRAS
ncbi:hypothetical protein VTO73DRAFT_6585 [Trametes versicolor]